MPLQPNFDAILRAITPLLALTAATPAGGGPAPDSIVGNYFRPQAIAPDFRAITRRNIRAITPEYSGDYPPPNPLA